MALKRISLYLSILIAYLLPLSSFSAHIIGGFMSYECIEIDDVMKQTKLRIKADLFRDAISGGASFDQETQFGIYSVQDGVYKYESFVSVELGNIITSSSFFLNDQIEITIEKGSYIFELDLQQDHDYLIAYQRCCRRIDISNILNPGETGFALQLLITKEGLEQCSRAVALNDIPNTAIYSGEQASINFDFSSSMNEENQFHFEAPHVSGGIVDVVTGGAMGCCDCVTPFPDICLPPYSSALFLPGYTSDKPFGTNADYNIDTTTGRIHGIFEENGIYAFSVRVEQKLDDALLSVQHLDFMAYIVPGTSSSSEAMVKNFSLYPNPTRKLLTIDLDQDIDEIIIYDESGHVQYSSTFNIGINQYRIDISNLLPGKYQLQLKSENKMLNKSFIKI